jgi:mannose-6-phosphate isomerase-like protein (cupin superfamily)
MNYKSINFKNKFSLFQDKWKPKVIAELNDYQFKIAKLEGDFIWHAHSDTDEAFIVISGELRIDFRDGAVTIRKGELFVVPKGVEHKPYAKNEVHLMMIEPVGVKNTGDEIESEITAENDIWI